MSRYDTMGLPTSASDVEIRERYLELARVVHPDTAGDPYQFRLLNEAYATLGKPTSRAAYDQRLSGSGADVSSVASSVISRKAPPGVTSRWLGGFFEDAAVWLLAVLLFAVLGVVAVASGRSFEEGQTVGLVALVLLLAGTQVRRYWRARQTR